MKSINLSKVNNINRPGAGGYVLGITRVEDHPLDPNTNKGDYLSIEYDIVEGPFKGYYTDMFNSLGFWGGRLIRSYKERALGMFKQFVNELKNDNPDFEWDMDGENDETSMEGCIFGAVLGEEEYRGNDGSIKKRLYVDKIVSVKRIHDADYKIPEPKTLQEPNRSTGVVDTTSDSIDRITEDLPI